MVYIEVTGMCRVLTCGVHGYVSCTLRGEMCVYSSERRVSLRSVLQCVAVCCSVLQCVTVCCSVLQCVVVCCNVLQCVAVYSSERRVLYTLNTNCFAR